MDPKGPQPVPKGRLLTPGMFDGSGEGHPEIQDVLLLSHTGKYHATRHDNTQQTWRRTQPLYNCACRQGTWHEGGRPRIGDAKRAGGVPKWAGSHMWTLPLGP
eukprot:7543959-Pyramimonas_sp.AAC.1